MGQLASRWAWMLVAFAVPVPARAQVADSDPRVVESRSHFENAERLYHEGADYALALTEYRRSMELLEQAGHPNAPLIEFNIARCYWRLGQNREAIASYESFLARSAGRDWEQRGTAEQELRELRQRLALDAEGTIHPVGPIVAGIGGAALIAGAITGGLALAANDAAEEGCIDGSCPTTGRARAEEATLLANATDGLLFGGLAVAAVGVLLIFVVPPEDAAYAEPAPVSAACTSQGCMLFARGRF